MISLGKYGAWRDETQEQSKKKKKKIIELGCGGSHWHWGLDNRQKAGVAGCHADGFRTSPLAYTAKTY
jgi:ubiquinone/menaquinone biosynthesis C-methylase UbiE